MTNYPRSAYGSTNVNAGYPANGDVAAWGGYCWPKGVPTGLLGTTNYTNKTNGQVLRVTMRKELVPLWNGIFQLCDLKYHYPIWSRGPADGKPWGPWGYDNRPISGTQRPSGHSVAVSVDINAPYNPYSYTFQSNMPPAMVADLESLGQYWGGRYTGQKYDAMHFGFCRKPSSVAAYIVRVNKLLAAISGTPVTPTPAPKPPSPTNPPVLKLTVDGMWGANSTRRAQQLYGTGVDGVVSKQSVSYKAPNPGLDGGWQWVASGATGSALIKAIQSTFGVKADGLIGPTTIKAMQYFYKLTADGKLSKNSPTIKALQTAWNAGRKR